MSYAKGTKVTTTQSEMDIRRVLERYGAREFGTMNHESGATVLFRIAKVAVRISLNFQANGRRLSDQAIRERWRALLLVIKAKLEAVASNISTIETEFLPFVVCGPGGTTVLDQLAPQLEDIRNGRPVNLQLPMPAGA